MSSFSTLAVIPARGGSKGIRRKNLQLLGGIPLIEWSIRVALQAARVDRVIVSTEDQEIAAIAATAGAEVMLRPEALAQDETPTMAVLQYVLAELAAQGGCPEGLVLLEPTSPFRTPDLIDACIGKLSQEGVRTCLTVTQLERNPYNIFAVTGDHAERFVRLPAGSFSRRQEFAHLKRLNGCVYAVRAANVLDGALVREPIRVVEMQANVSTNIDSMFDLELARMLVENGSVVVPERSGGLG